MRGTFLKVSDLLVTWLGQEADARFLRRQNQSEGVKKAILLLDCVGYGAHSEFVDGALSSVSLYGLSELSNTRLGGLRKNPTCENYECVKWP